MKSSTDFESAKKMFCRSVSSTYQTKTKIPLEKTGYPTWDKYETALASSFTEDCIEKPNKFRKVYVSKTGQVLGYVSYNIEKNTVYVSQFCVDAQHQRQGIATQLFDTMVNHCTGHFKSPFFMWLYTRYDNTPAINFYKKQKFNIDVAPDASHISQDLEEPLPKTKYMIVDRRYPFTNKEYTLYRKMIDDFNQGTLPSIAHQTIKEIPIKECNEPLFDLKTLKGRIEMIPTPPNNATFVGPDFNAGHTNAGKVRDSVYNALKEMVQELDSLAPFFGYEPGRISIRVFEGLRDLTFQKQLFDNKVKEIMTSNPNIKLEAATKEASKWVSPAENNVPPHSTGAAVDMRLWDNKTGTFVDMGTFGVIWQPNDAAPTFSTSANLTETQKRNRLYMFLAAWRAGLVNYPFEFWHFSKGDRYAAYVLNQPHAIYGPIKV